ncbi:CDP-alcohol phosphatidyltransferase family protein [Chloroflexota bacterium]
MSEEGQPSLRKENGIPVFFKEGLADILTFSRGLIGLAIVSLSFVGEDAYLAVVILVLVGVVTDLFDGRVARHYLEVLSVEWLKESIIKEDKKGDFENG